MTAAFVVGTWGCDEPEFVQSEVAIDAPAFERPGDLARCLVVANAEFGGGGALDIMDVDSFAIQRDRVATHHDARIVVDNNEVIIINREGGDNIQLSSPGEGLATRWQWSTGNGSNPWTWVRVGDRAFVPLYGSAEVLEVAVGLGPNGQYNATIPVVERTWQIDAPDEADGLAEVAGVLVRESIAAGPTAYALVQGLGAYPGCNVGDHGRLVPLDDEAQPVELIGCNPSERFVQRGDLVAFANMGGNRSLGYTTNDGGIEVLDVATGISSGLLVDEAELGNEDALGIFPGVSNDWLLTADDAFVVHVRPITWSVDTVEVGDAIHSGESIFDLEERYGRLWIADRTPDNPGVVQLDPATGETLFGGQRIRTTYPPFEIDFIEVDGECNGQ